MQNLRAQKLFYYYSFLRILANVEDFFQVELRKKVSYKKCMELYEFVTVQSMRKHFTQAYG